MRYLVISDIHANIEALDVCLADAATHGYDRTVVLGDIVGYGPDPNAVIDRVIALAPIAMVRGNHDKIAFGLHLAEGFNPSAR
jgi:predicted phosphodiesterase